MTKLIMLKVEPEYQGDWLTEELMEVEDIMITGNRDFIGIENIETFGLVDNGSFSGLEWLVQEYLDFIETEETSLCNYESKEEIIYDYIQIKELDGKKLKAIENEILRYKEVGYVEGNEEDTLCNILNIITGKKYEYSGIHGYCQGDWQYLIYNADTVDKNKIEAWYFNTGTEWKCIEMEDEVEFDLNYDLDNDVFYHDSYFHYSVNYDKEGILHEMKEYGEYSNIEIYEFDGHIRTPKYKKVS